MLYRVLCVFCLLVLVVFSASVRRYGMEGIYVGLDDIPLVAARGLYPSDFRGSDRLIFLFVCIRGCADDAFSILPYEASPAIDRLCIGYRFSGVVDRVRIVRIDGARLSFCSRFANCSAQLVRVRGFVGSIVQFLSATFRGG